jgi:hypothetical protein
LRYSTSFVHFISERKRSRYHILWVVVFLPFLLFSFGGTTKTHFTHL